jgi:hypothetical protein
MLYLIPALFLPLVPISSGQPDQNGNGKPSKEHKATSEGVLVWSIRNGGAFIDTYHEDVVAVFTVVLAFSTIMLWSQTKRLAEGADEQSKKMQASIDAANRNAIATQNAADAMQELADETETARLSAELSTQRQLRAYLAVEPGGIIQRTAEYNVSGYVFVRNVGKVPAQGVSVKIHLLPSVDKNPKFPPFDRDIELAMRAIQPSAKMRQGSADQIDINEATKVGQYLFVWGTVFYHDGFDKRRFTNFCHRYWTDDHNRYHHSGEAVSGSVTVISYEKARYHTEGNNSD